MALRFSCITKLPAQVVFSSRCRLSILLVYCFSYSISSSPLQCARKEWPSLQQSWVFSELRACRNCGQWGSDSVSTSALLHVLFDELLLVLFICFCFCSVSVPCTILVYYTALFWVWGDTIQYDTSVCSGEQSNAKRLSKSESFRQSTFVTFRLRNRGTRSVLLT